MKKTVLASMLALALGVSGVSAAGQLGGVTDAAKKAGSVTKDAGKATVETTEKVAGTAGHEVKKAGEKTKTAVTGKAHAKCADGTQAAGKSQKAADAACKGHGGLSK